MLFMLNNTTNHRDIHWGWSADGRGWTFDQKPLVSHADVGAVNVGGPHLLTRNGSAYVVYNTDKGSGGNLLITEVGNDFSRRDHLGLFHDSLMRRTGQRAQRGAEFRYAERDGLHGLRGG